MSDATKNLVNEIINVCVRNNVQGDDLLKALSTVYVSCGYVMLREQFSHEDICTSLLMIIANILAQKDLLNREPTAEEVAAAEAVLESKKSKLN